MADCGCLIYHACPLHQAAPAMFKALEGLMAGLSPSLASAIDDGLVLRGQVPLTPGLEAVTQAREAIKEARPERTEPLP